MVDLSLIPPEFLNTIPAAQPPPGVISNFLNPAENRIGCRLAVYITLPMAIISLIMRIYTRLRISGGIGADDLFAVASGVSNCLRNLWRERRINHHLGLVMDDLLGLHMYDINIGRLNEPFLKAIIPTMGLYSLGAILVKLCLLLLYIRMFRPRNVARVLIWAAFAFIPLFYIATVIAFTIFYMPKKGEDWISPRSPSTTHKMNNVTSVQGIVGIVTDFYILLIPLWFVSGLRLPLGRKIGVSAIFLSGLIACVCAVVGCVYRFKARKSLDSFWDTMIPYTLTVVELNVGIVCSCMPIIFVVFKKAVVGNTFVARLLYYRSRRSGPTTKEEVPPSSDPSERVNPGLPPNVLPEVPRPVMTGMRSFIWKGARSKPVDTGVVSYHELQSINDDYHQQLRK
ncbi:hypothetical protein GLAREA_12220 [Glarea lozoyensis ATCC 20868]|uniref:Rhodopsin domain-containing protein n=1 Tax=Glarea lozoyensis (strain ATCC 20868 / MF5171) TaxID=1116229 RepID=S3E0U0_GLAL2|nr:uncharacterized protein GLAREA_12220 [Glarea lozoyensis ATCC 20868]EPE32138.1 hypothetical protein GLAREA_12220 [Glarea lozoyensis ATCC 20868]